jgi:hypothetical protein
MAANDVSSTDGLLINDGGVLKKTTVGDVLNSNLPVTTSSVTGGTGVDLILTPAAGQKVDIAGNIEADDINATDDVSVGGDLTVTGSSTLTGNVIADNGFTSNGVANFTGTLQVNGTVGYMLTEIVEENIPYAVGAAANTLHNLFTSASYTKTTGELWMVEVDAWAFVSANGSTHFRLTDSADTTNYAIGYEADSVATDTFPVSLKAYLNTSNTHSGTFVLRFKNSSGSMSVTPSTTNLSGYPDGSKGSISKFRIYKYRTA